MTVQATSNPFVGLRPFESNESLLFFGRQQQTLELLQRLHQNKFVAVVGSSGSGKSSLIKAGLIPSLKAGYLVGDRDRWVITIMKPGQSPLYNLAKTIIEQLQTDADEEAAIKLLLQKIDEEGVDAVLSKMESIWKEKNTNFFLLVDQFEELFRFSMEQKDVVKKDEATDFVNIILELSKQADLPIYVVITMRSDFIGDCSQFYGLPEAMNESQYLVPRLNRVQLKAAIEGPVKLYGRQINAALTSKLLNDAFTVKDELPLLEHALMRVWDYEMNVDKNGELDLHDYEAIGGIEKALSNHADEALKGMTDEELGLTKKIFQSLTTIDENGRKIRRPVYMKDLQAITGAGREQLLDIINRFIEDKRSFLIISKAGEAGNEIIDISHESLIRQWSTLSGWVDEEGDAAKNYERLVESADLYKQGKKDLLGGSELLILSRWYNTFQPTEIWAKRYTGNFDESIGYLNESIQHKKFEEEQKVKRRRRAIALASLAILAIITSLIFFSIKQRNLKSLAEAQRKIAEDSTKSAQQQRTLLAESIKEVERQRNNAYAAESLAVAARKEAEKQTAIASAQKKIAEEKTNEALKQEALAKKAFADLETESAKTTRQYNAFKYNALAYEWESKDPTVALQLAGAAMKLDSDSIFISTANRIYERNSFYKTILKDSFATDVDYIFSNDGKRVLLKTYYRSEIWNLKGDETKPFYSYEGDPAETAFSPDLTKQLVYKGDSVNVFNTINKEKIIGFKNDAAIIDAGFSGDGNKISVAGLHNANIRDLQGRKILSDTNQNNISSIYTSPDGKLLLTESLTRSHDTGYATYRFKDGSAVTEKTFVFVRKTTRVRRSGYKFTFFANKRRAIFFADSTIHLWNIAANTDTIYHAHALIKKVILSADNSKVLASLDNKTAVLWQANNTVNFVGHTDNINDINLSADGSRILTASDDNSVRLWRSDGTLITQLNSPYRVLSAKFSTDGSKIYTGLEGGLLRAWYMPVHEFIGHTDEINLVAYSPDGTKILTCSQDSTIRLWTTAGNTIRKIKCNDVIASVAFSPSGKNFIAAYGNVAELWNINDTASKQLTGHSGVVQSAAFSPDGTKVLTGSEDSTVRLWNLNNAGDTGRVVCRHNGTVVSVSFSPDGEKILSGSFDSSIKISNPDGSLQMKVKQPAEVYSIMFSPDGKMILAGLKSGVGMLLSINGDSLKAFEHENTVESVAFSPDGKQILTGSWDNTAKLWDTDGKLLRTFRIPDESKVRSVTFSADGKKIFIGAGDGLGRLYDIRPIQEFLKSDDIDILAPGELNAINNKKQE